MNKHKLPSLLFYIITAELVGGISALITGSFSDFFVKYQKPPLLPPAWVFPVVWVILFALMGYSAFLISQSNTPSNTKRKAMSVYLIQLFFNFWWSILFFKAELLWVSVIDIVILLILIAVMISVFYKTDKKAGLINIPYLLWVGFATYLNIATAVIN